MLTFDKPYWLGISIGGALELAPRTPPPPSSAAFSFRALRNEDAEKFAAPFEWNDIKIEKKNKTAKFSHFEINYSIRKHIEFKPKCVKYF